jgi:uncharacterized protein
MNSERPIYRRFTAAKNAGPIFLHKRSAGAATIEGYGAVFYNSNDPGTEYIIGPGVVECINPTAFDAALKDCRDDARGLFNHEPSQLLGRVGSGTMRLSVDSKGLRYAIDVPNTQLGRDLLELIDRGDLYGSSFSFTIDAVRWRHEDDRDVRLIDAVTLYDTGPVTFPAYESTTTSANESNSSGRNQGISTEAAKVRKRVLEINETLSNSLKRSGFAN